MVAADRYCRFLSVLYVHGLSIEEMAKASGIRPSSLKPILFGERKWIRAETASRLRYILTLLPGEAA